MLPAWAEPVADSTICPACGAGVRVSLFPSAFVQHDTRAGELAAEGEAVCYDHPAKQAIASCAECGRLVCQLCAVDFQGATWCPSCLASGSERKRTAALEGSRTLYDSLALMLALWPLVIWPFTFLTAPATLYVVIRYWNKPTGLLRRGKWRMILAFLIALAQIVAWVWGIYYLVSIAQTRLTPPPEAL
jgi:hypothetical protein